MVHIWRECVATKPGLNIGVTRRGEYITSIVCVYDGKKWRRYFRLRWWPRFNFIREKSEKK